MYQLAPNIDLLFTEAGDITADRVRAAAAAGFDAVEMWGPTGKDMPALKAALEETGVQLTAQLAEPRMQFMIPPRNHEPFYAGSTPAWRSRSSSAAPHRGGQRHRIRRPQAAGPAGRTDRDLHQGHRAHRGIRHHPGPRTGQRPGRPPRCAPGPDRAKPSTSPAGVDSPFFGVLYDLYHSTVEGEDVAAELANAGDLIKYVQIADAPGRGEPGSGSIDWHARLADLRNSGYAGPIGLEYYPTIDSAKSVRRIQELVAGR